MVYICFHKHRFALGCTNALLQLLFSKVESGLYSYLHSHRSMVFVLSFMDDLSHINAPDFVMLPCTDFLNFNVIHLLCCNVAVDEHGCVAESLQAAE